MIHKGSRGAGFRGALTYVLAKEHAPQIVGGNMAGRNASDLTREFARTRQLRPDVEKPVYHVSLSFAPEDRRLTADELAQIADRYMERMGYGRTQYVVVEHRDRAHQHVHIIGTRIHLDGKLVRYSWNDWAAGMKVLRGIERDLHLRPVVRDAVRGARGLTQEEYRLAFKEGRPSERLELQALLDRCLEGRPNLTEFVGRLAGEGITARVTVDEDGQILGMSYRLEGGAWAFRGSALGPGYSWAGLRERGLAYEPRSDAAVLREVGLVKDRARRTAGEPWREDLETLRLLVRGASEDHPSPTEFLERLSGLGVGARLNVARTGHVSGITYTMEGRPYRGSELGREFSWAGIQRQGVAYDPERDAAAVARVASHRPEAVTPTGAVVLGRVQLEGVRAAVERALADRPSFTEFAERLAGGGVGLRLHIGAQGQVEGLRFVHAGVEVRATDLGRYSWVDLQRAGLRYHAGRDRAAVERIERATGDTPRRLAGQRPTQVRGSAPGPTPEQVRFLRGAVARAWSGGPSFTDFARRLESAGVALRIQRGLDSHPAGIAYVLGGTRVRSAQLGPAYGWEGIRRRGIDVDERRDRAALERAVEAPGVLRSVAGIYRATHRAWGWVKRPHVEAARLGARLIVRAVLRAARPRPPMGRTIDAQGRQWPSRQDAGLPPRIRDTQLPEQARIRDEALTGRRARNDRLADGATRSVRDGETAPQRADVGELARSRGAPGGRSVVRPDSGRQREGVPQLLADRSVLRHGSVGREPDGRLLRLEQRPIHAHAQRQPPAVRDVQGSVRAGDLKRSEPSSLPSPLRTIPTQGSPARTEGLWWRARLLADRLEGGLVRSRPELLGAVHRLRQLAAHPVVVAGAFAAKKLAQATRPRDRADEFDRSR